MSKVPLHGGVVVAPPRPRRRGVANSQFAVRKKVVFKSQYRFHKRYEHDPPLSALSVWVVKVGGDDGELQPWRFI